MALTAARPTQNFGSMPLRLQLAVDGGSNIHKGAIVALDGSGYLVPGSTSATLLAQGCAAQDADNTSGSNGAISCLVEAGVFKFANGSSSIAATDFGKACYIVDDQTVHLTDGSGTRSPAGIIVGVDSDGVRVHVSPDISRMLVDVGAVLATGVSVATKAIGHADLTDADTQQTIDFDAALPAGAMVVASGANVTAIFDNAGDTASVTFDLGIKSGDTDCFVDGGSLNAVAKVCTPAGVSPTGLVGAITPSVIVDGSVNLDTLTKGAAVFYVAYVLAF